MGTSNSTNSTPAATREPRARGITVALPAARIAYTNALLVAYTDGGPFVYIPHVAAATAGEIRVEYIDGYLADSPQPYTIVRLERRDATLSARLMTPVQSTLDAYLIARSVYHLAADGHFGEVRVEVRVGEVRVGEVRFHGFDGARGDVAKLARRDTMPSAATEQAIRAMPARGPCVLDRLAEWQLSSAVVSRESMYESLCGFIRFPAHQEGDEEEVRIPVFSTVTQSSQKGTEEAKLARKHLEGAVRGRRVEGRLFLEPFWTPKGATSIVSWLVNSTEPELKEHDVHHVRGGSLANVVESHFGPRIASALKNLRALMGLESHERQVAYPAADPIAVYVRRPSGSSGSSGSSEAEHWLLRKLEGSGGVTPTRAWVHLAPRVYLLGVDGSGTAASLGVLRMLAAMYTPPGARRAIDAAADEWARSEGKDGHKEAWAAWAKVKWDPPRAMLLEESTPSALAWRASGLFAAEVRQARLLLSIGQIVGTRGIVVIANVPGHVMCGVLVLSRREGEVGGRRTTTARLLVRDSMLGAGEIELTSQFNEYGDEEIPLSIEHVGAPDAHYTQDREGSCGYHAIMFAMYLLDTAPEAVRRGNLDEIRRIMRTRPPPLYALVARRILVYYVRDDNADDFPDAHFLDAPRTRAEYEERTAMGVYPVTVRLPGVGGALVSFRFVDPTRERSVRVDAYIDANFSVVLVLGGQTYISMAERCFAFARYSVSRIYPGALVSGPVPRVKGMIVTKRRRA